LAFSQLVGRPCCIVAFQPKASRWARVDVSLPSDMPRRLSWASAFSALIGSLASADMQSALEKQVEFFQEAVWPLQEAVDSLHDWMLAIGGFHGSCVG
jgi:hypothetical protein